MNHSIKLENIGCLITESVSGFDYSNNTSLVLEGDCIKSIGSGSGDTIIDCKGKLVTPGFVDSHTHLIFNNLRTEEHRLRLSGATYEEIANNGGGIISSVESVRSATSKELFDMAIPRLDRFISMGTTTIEAKSGYCLDLEFSY